MTMPFDFAVSKAIGNLTLFRSSLFFFLQWNLDYPDLDYRISRLSGLFLWSQYDHEFLLVTIKIRSHILCKTTALKGAVKCEGFLLSKSKSRACVVTNEEHSNEF